MNIQKYKELGYYELLEKALLIRLSVIKAIQENNLEIINCMCDLVEAQIFLNKFTDARKTALEAIALRKDKPCMHLIRPLCMYIATCKEPA